MLYCPVQYKLQCKIPFKIRPQLRAKKLSKNTMKSLCNNILMCTVIIIKYSVFFFMRPKVNANFTYLYLIEINDWCLIFSSMLGHLIIYKEIQILIIMLLVKLENLKLVGFHFCCVECRICRYTKLNIFCFVPVSAV